MSASPHDPLFVFTTDRIAPEARYDHWVRLISDHWELDPLSSDEALAFQAELVAFVGEDGQVRLWRSSAASGYRTAAQCRPDDRDEIVLSYMVAGQTIYEPQDDAPTLATAGKFYCADSARQSRVRWTAHRQLQVALPRAAVAAAIGPTIPPPSVIARVMNASRLAPYLVRHLRRLMREHRAMSASERVAMLDATLQLACGVLRGAFHSAPAAQDDDSLYQLARRFINQRLHEPGLAAAQIAAALNCSRAHLYRVFAERGVTIAQCVREARLGRACRLLEGARALDIAVIAWRCGYADASSFGKAFKRRYGITPQDWRRIRKVEPVAS